MKAPEPGPTTATDGDRAPDLLVVDVGGVEFGLDTAAVTEVARVPPITRLPFPPADVVGVASLRGTILPVLDLGGRLLGKPGAAGRIVVARDPGFGAEIALLVDGVTDIVTDYRPIRDALAEVTGSLPEGWIRSVVSAEPDRVITVLDLARVLARPADDGASASGDGP